MENTITPKNFALNNGQDYTSQPAFADIMAKDSYDKDLAIQYKETAMTELAALGVTFPVKVLVRYNPSTTNWEEECVVLEQQLESVLGQDYIDVIVEAGPSSGFLGEVRRASNYMLLLTTPIRRPGPIRSTRRQTGTAPITAAPAMRTWPTPSRTIPLPLIP